MSKITKIEEQISNKIYVIRGVEVMLDITLWVF